jgi:hypothetical protein
MGVAITWDPKPDPVEDEHLQDIKEPRIWDPANPTQALIPSIVSEKVIRFEAALSQHLINPVLKSIDASGDDGLERKLQILVGVEQYLMANQSDSLAEPLQAACAEFVDVSRGIRHLLHPLDTKFPKQFQRLSSAEQSDTRATWAGLAVTTWAFLKTLPFFQPHLDCHLFKVCL